MDIKQLIGETTYYDKKLALETKRQIGRASCRERV